VEAKWQTYNTENRLYQIVILIKNKNIILYIEEGKNAVCTLFSVIFLSADEYDVNFIKSN
jgi:hypothetical protein